MKKNIIMFFLTVWCFIIQTSFIATLNCFSLIPNFSLMLLVTFSMLSDGLTGGILGLITGLLYDVMIYDVFGIYSLVLFFIGFLIGSFSGDILRENYLAYSMVTGISTVVMHSFLYLILFFLKFRLDSAVNILPGILAETAMNAILVIFVLKFVLYLFDKLNLKA